MLHYFRDVFIDSGLVIDSAGNLYGMTFTGGSSGAAANRPTSSGSVDLIF
ncbi:MAG TPA: hypothetical protein VM715_07380 [Candidatus Acidoferrum sp.]|nr:hypothetical protein [Candidatus Acidoferrum sp.]